MSLEKCGKISLIKTHSSQYIRSGNIVANEYYYECNYKSVIIREKKLNMVLN